MDGVPPEFGADLMPPDLDRVEHIIEAAMARIPVLGEGGVKSVINGPITFTPGCQPSDRPGTRQVENAWLLTGSSMGVMEGGGAGWFLAHWMTHGAPPMDALAVDPAAGSGRGPGVTTVLPRPWNASGCNSACTIPHEERPAGRGSAPVSSA